ncbi:MAG: group I intron-associated PD-(D/E)XK endonuclease [Bacteroidota bacterium]
METKLKGDIAEQKVILKCLEFSRGVSIPIGDRLPYDLVIDVHNSLFKIQVKSAWFDKNKNNWVVDNRRSLTNQKLSKKSKYTNNDFDFAIIVIEELNVFYIMPSDIFNSYGSEIHLIETTKRQRKPKSWNYREAWNLILHGAAEREISQ